MQNVLELDREVGEAQVGVFLVGKISFKLETAWTPSWSLQPLESSISSFLRPNEKQHSKIDSCLLKMIWDGFYFHSGKPFSKWEGFYFSEFDHLY